MFNAIQGLDAIFGGFGAGMHAIRQRNEERANEEYFLNRLTAIQDWGQQGWDQYMGVHSAYAKLHAAWVSCQDMNAHLPRLWQSNAREITALKAEITRLKAGH